MIYNKVSFGCRIVVVVVRTEMPRCNQAVATLIARPTADEYSLVLASLFESILVGGENGSDRVNRSESLGDGESSEFHELLEGERAFLAHLRSANGESLFEIAQRGRTHQFRVDRLCDLSRDVAQF